MNNKLYVGNLLYEVNEEDLKDYFGAIGPVLSAQIIRFRDDGKSKGFGFVEMQVPEDAQKAIDAYHGKDYKGRNIVVSQARPQEPRQDRGIVDGGSQITDVDMQ